MTATIEVIFDDKAVLGALDRLALAGRDAAPLMARIGSGLVDSARLRFNSNVGPDGVRWKPLNPAYDAFRRPGPILVQSGALRNSLTYRPGAREVTIGSPMIYAGVQQFGARIVPRTKKALVFRLGGAGAFIRVRAVTIPARPFLGVSAEDEVMIIARAQRYMTEIFSQP